MTSLSLRALTTVQAIVRRRLTVGILIAMPIAFSLATHDTVGRSVRALVFGVSWAVSTVAFFATVSARELEPRLILAGWRRRDLVVGRILGLAAVVVALTTIFTVVVWVDHDVRSLAAVVVDFAVTGAVAIAVGLAVGTLIGREMEGTLILFFLAGLQAVVNPFDPVSRALPFWSSRELGTWAIDGPGAGSPTAGLVHALVVVVVCAAAVEATSLVRLRRPVG